MAQLVSLPGVVAAGSIGLANVDMHAGDIAAAQIPSLLHAISVRRLYVDLAGVWAGKSRTGGAVITGLGLASGFTLLASDPVFNNRATLASTVDAGLRLPAGDVAASFTCVLVASFSAAMLVGNVQRQIFGTSAVGVNWGMNWRVRGIGAGLTEGLAFTPDYPASTATSTVPHASLPAADVPGVFCCQWSHTTRTAKQCINNTTILDPVTNGALAVNTAATYAYGLGDSFAPHTNSMVGKIADCYIFAEPLLDDPYGVVQLGALITALKTYYGIA